MSISVGTCAFSGCSKSYLTDKDIAFFKFPDDPERRKKWIFLCETPDLIDMNDRQLRGKRVCALHFPTFAFVNPQNKHQLLDTAIPSQVSSGPSTPETKAKPKPSLQSPKSIKDEKVDEDSIPSGMDNEEEPTSTSDKQDDNGDTPKPVKRGRGRPPATVKSEVPVSLETKDNDNAEDEKKPTKRGRGRPPRLEKAEEPVGSSSSDDEKDGNIEITPTPGKRGRGRPPRLEKVEEPIAPLSSGSEEDGNVEITPTPGKRGRGRPPRLEKKPSTSEKQDGNVEDTPTPKRGRGRPPMKKPADDSQSNRESETQSSSQGSSKKPKIEVTKRRSGRAVMDSKKDDATPVSKKFKDDISESDSEPAPAPKKRGRKPKMDDSVVQAAVTMINKRKSDSEVGSGSSSLEKVADKCKGDANAATSNVSSSALQNLNQNLKDLQLPVGWTVCAVVWDPKKKQNILPICEHSLCSGGQLSLKSSIQIYEDMDFKIYVHNRDGSILTEVKSISGVEDVAKIVEDVTTTRLCEGIKQFQSEFSSAFQGIITNGQHYFSEDCSIITESRGRGSCVFCEEVNADIQERNKKKVVQLDESTESTESNEDNNNLKETIECKKQQEVVIIDLANRTEREMKDIHFVSYANSRTANMNVIYTTCDVVDELMNISGSAKMSNGSNGETSEVNGIVPLDPDLNSDLEPLQIQGFTLSDDIEYDELIGEVKQDEANNPGIHSESLVEGSQIQIIQVHDQMLNQMADVDEMTSEVQGIMNIMTSPGTAEFD